MVFSLCKSEGSIIHCMSKTLEMLAPIQFSESQQYYSMTFLCIALKRLRGGSDVKEELQEMKVDCIWLHIL